MLKLKLLNSLFCLLALITLGSNAAASEAVRCVQSQLNHLGYEAGVVDGKIGVNTRRALKKYEKVFGSISQRSFDKYRAVVFCRDIGRHIYFAKQYWPSKIHEHEFVFESSIEKSRETYLKVFSNIVLQEFSENFEVDMVLPVKLILGNDAKELRQLAKKHSNIDAKVLDESVKRRCFDDKGRLSGFTMPGLIFGCLNSNPKNLKSYANPRSFFAHEFFHQFQYQAAGVHSGPHGGRSELENYGPWWLLEGAATFFGETLGKDRDAKVRIRYHLRNWATSNMKIKNVNLEHFEFKKLQKKKDWDLVYNVGVLGVLRLIESNGEKSLIRFYNEFGLSKDWKSTFANVFGTSVSDFYKEVSAIKY